MKDAGPGSHHPKKPLKKKNSGLQSIESTCRVGILPVAHPHSGEKQLESRLVLGLQLMGWALGSLLEATVAIYSPWAAPIGSVLAVL